MTTALSAYLVNTAEEDISTRINLVMLGSQAQNNFHVQSNPLYIPGYRALPDFEPNGFQSNNLSYTESSIYEPQNFIPTYTLKKAAFS